MGARVAQPVPALAGMEAVLRERSRRQRRERLERLVMITSPIILLIVWEVVAIVGLVDIRFFPRPSLVIAQLVAMTASGELWEHLSVTLLRIGVGFLFGATGGVVIGLLMGGSRWARAILRPRMAPIYPIPKIAICPLPLLAVGHGRLSHSGT